MTDIEVTVYISKGDNSYNYHLYGWRLLHQEIKVKTILAEAQTKIKELVI